MQTSGEGIARWHEANRLRLTGLGAWLSGKEPGRADPAGFDPARLRILFCRLSTYRDVRHSISHRMLYWAAGSVAGVYADLAWLPPPRDARLMAAAGIPWWTASGSRQAPSAFDILAVSISVPQEALNLPAALRHSGVALSRAERLADKTQPLVILGGQAAGSAPFIHGDGGRGLVDAVCLGDGIDWLREVLALGLRAGRGRLHGMLADLAGIPGSYIPSFYAHRHDASGSLSIAAAAADVPMPAVHRVDPPGSWTGRYDGAFIPFDDEDQEETLPLAFGCRYRCRFCQTGWARQELTSAPADALVACASRLKSAMAASDLNLLASDACSIDGLDSIVARLASEFRHVSVKSLALASLARHPAAGAAIRLLDKREFTFGVEGISPRLRRWLGKQAEAPVLLDAVKLLARSGIRQLKLFFILTGLEQEKDAQDLRALLDAIRAAQDCRVIASFMPLFRAPFTPLQFAPLREPDAMILRSIRQSVAAAGAEFRLSAGPAEIQLMNLMCRAGRRAMSTLLHLSLDRGLLYYGHLPEEVLATARRHMAREGIYPESLAGDLSDSVLPWDDIQAGHTRGQLLASYRAAQEDAARGSPDGSPARSVPANRALRQNPRAEPAAEIVMTFRLELEPDEALLPDVTLARGALRRLFIQDPDLAVAYRGLPGLIRFPFASGRALLQASFRADVEVKTGQSAQAPRPDAAWYVVRFGADPRRVRHWLERFRLSRVPVQSVRRGDSRWHLVSAPHRARAGLAAAVESRDALRLICSSALAGQPKDDDLEFIAGGITEAVGEMEPGKCRICGSRRFRPFHGEPWAGFSSDFLCAH